MGKNVKHGNRIRAAAKWDVESKLAGKWVWYPLSGPSSKGLYMAASALVAALVYQVQFGCTSAAKSKPTVLLVFVN